LLGADHLFLAGALGAVIVTWFTFLFSFVFILAGAPIIESTHNELKFTAPLTAITAAVVGLFSIWHFSLVIMCCGHRVSITLLIMKRQSSQLLQ
jgi:hypothetical protein